MVLESNGFEKNVLMDVSGVATYHYQLQIINQTLSDRGADNNIVLFLGAWGLGLAPVGSRGKAPGRGRVEVPLKRVISLIWELKLKASVLIGHQLTM